nr:ABC transporter permease [Kordiimonas marina]
MDSISSLGRLLSFLGLVLIRLIGSLLNPGRLRLIPILHQMDVVGLRAMGIVGLISFLIGAVMVNQGAIQLAKFGADIFVIDMLGIAHLRELGILLTAIIIAGRSGSAFTAQIGSMKLHEEVDAMMTLGMNPIDVLVLPRLIALVICLPLLTFYADLIGIIGGALMAWVQLDITPANFFVYFRDVISIDHYWVGIIKAPFFAAVIATCGCYQGLQVEGSADALGSRTTKSVVQAIFLVIALDALFSVFFTAIDL